MYAGIEWTEGGLLLTGAEPTPFELEVRYQREGEPPTAWRPQRAEAVSGGWRLSGDDLELELGARAEHGGLRIDWSLTPSRDIRLHQVLLARFDQRLPHLADLPRARAFRHGFQSWTPSTGVRGDHLEVRPLVKAFSLMTHHMDSRWWARKDGFTSYAFVVLQRGGDEALLLGFLGHRRGHGELFVRTRGGRELVASADYGGRRCAGGEVLPGEALWIGRGSPNPLMERYAELTAAEMGMAGGRCPGSPVDPSQSPLGWCSWYEYYAGVSEQDVLSNLEVLADQPHLGVAVVQLDDGFQTAVGDWLSFNDKFPRGLAPLAADIRARGFQAGVWTAPFFASARSRLFQEHPDWFLRHPRGKPVFAGYNPVWNTRLYSLDLTRPDVERWLGETFGALVEAGFDYFKIDFLFAGLRHGQHFDPGRSPVEAYRTGLRVIREAIGPERFLLGCGAPLGPSVGYVDAMRISQDVKESWDDWYARLFGRECGYPTARGALRNVITRSFLHRRWWLNDPDCVLVRDRNTKLDLEETRLLVTVLGMSGGMLLLSDDLSTLTPERLGLAEVILPATPLTALPEDPLEAVAPGSYVLEGPGRRLVARINWGERPVQRPVAGVDGETAFDFWLQDVVEGDQVEVARHGVRALLFTPASSSPRVVGTTLHLAALVDGRLEDSWSPEARVLTIAGQRLARSEGEFFLRVPDGLELVRDDLPPEVTGVRDGAVGPVLALSVDRQAPTWQIALRFAAVDGGGA